MSESTYFSPKIRSYAARLKESPDQLNQILDEIKDTYTSLSSYQTALNRLRNFFVTCEEYHPAYGSYIDNLEKEIVHAYSKSITPDLPQGNPALMSCVKFIYDFKSIPLKRQIKLLYKIKRGDYLLPERGFGDQFKKLPLLPDYVRNLHLSPEQQIAFKSESSQHLFQLSTNVTVVNDCDKLVKKMVSILKSKTKTVEDQAVALAFLTGRRTTEILKTGQLQALPGYPYAAYFQGQLKNGLKNISTVTEDVEDVYVIPLLAKYQLINTNMESVQAHVATVIGPDGTNETVNQKFSNKLSKAAKALILPHLRFHDLRTMYALIAYEAFKPHTAGINGFVAKCLGHTSVSVSSSYTRMQVNNCPQNVGKLPPEFYEF
jgi:hypothetical protein